MNSRPIKRRQAARHRSPRKASRDRESLILGALGASRVRAHGFDSRPRRAESENRFNFRERAETSACDSETRPRKGFGISARLGSSRKSRKSGMYHTKCAYDSDREAEWVLQLSNTTSTALYHTKCAQSTDLESNWVLQLTNTAMKLSLTLTLWS